MIDSDKQTKSDKGRATIYLLPNLITTAALLCGFYALYATFQGTYVFASVAIVLAAVLDALDGRVARYTKSATNFGAEYDNLSDMVAFGVAPAVLVLHAFLLPLANIGWIVAFTYTACTALRLARYASQPDSLESFTGLASPAAAVVLATFVWVFVGVPEIKVLEFSVSIAVAGAILAGVMGVMMISNFLYWSPKNLSFRSKVSFMAMSVLVFGFALIALAPATTLLALFALYAVSGPLMGCYRLAKRIVLRPNRAPAPVVVMPHDERDAASASSNKKGA